MTKKFFALALGAMLVCGAITMIGCNRYESDMIVGKWEETSFVFTYSGSPNPSQNYSNYLSIGNCMGCGNTTFVFRKDNTGMIITSGIGPLGDSFIDTTLFTYSLDGVRRMMSVERENNNPDWTTTWEIREIKSREVVIHEKTTVENYHDYVGDTTTHYTRINETWHFCEKK